jgi:hypothetical protein
MYVIKNNRGRYYTGIIYHAECGHHAGFWDNLNAEGDLKPKMFRYKHEADNEKFMLQEVFKENKLDVKRIQYMEVC